MLSFIAPSISDKIKVLVKLDDAKGLMKFLKSDKKEYILHEYYNYALRLSAMQGSIHCLNHILSTRKVDIFDTDPQTKKIALHYALNRGHMGCILALLRATDVLDFYDPAGQLLFGEKPDRPIDVIKAMNDELKKFEIAYGIEDVLMSYHGINTGRKQRDEINVFLHGIYLDKLFYTM